MKCNFLSFKNTYQAYRYCKQWTTPKSCLAAIPSLEHQSFLDGLAERLWLPHQEKEKKEFGMWTSGNNINARGMANHQLPCLKSEGKLPYLIFFLCQAGIFKWGFGKKARPFGNFTFWAKGQPDRKSKTLPHPHTNITMSSFDTIKS